MASQLKVNEIIKQSGSSIVIGENGDTVSGPFTNVPAFEASLGSNQTLSNNTQTIMQANTETYDTDSCYDTSTYKFTPNVAGKYLCYGQVNIQGGTINNFSQISLRKNGNTVVYSLDRYAGDGDIIPSIQKIIDFNGSSDYLEVYIRQNSGSSKDAFATYSFFGAYRITGA